MNSLQSKLTYLRGSSVALAAALLTGVLASGPASAQSAVRAAAAPPSASQDATTRREVVTHDPFSPFVYDALGATPSIQLPAFLGKPGRARAVDQSAVPSAENADKDVTAKPTVAASVESNGSARVP